MTEIKHEYTDEIVCPYCGHEFSDSWEYIKQNEGIIDCQDCRKAFYLKVNQSVDYSTKKVPCANDEDEHNWSKWTSYGQTNETRYCKECDKREYRKEEVKE